MLTLLNYRDIIKNVIGSKIARAQYNIHSFERIVSVISVNMIFENQGSVNLQCASDGESLLITQDIPQVADLGDSGRIDLVDISEFDPALLLPCMENPLQRATIETYEDVPKTLRMDWGGRTVFFSNVGDTLNFEEARFDQMISEERWKSLTSVTFR